MRFIFAIGALAALPALLGLAGEAAASAFDKVKIEAGQKLYVAECRRCHAPDAQHESYGPSL